MSTGDEQTERVCVQCGDDLDPEVLARRPEQALCEACVQELRERRAGQRLGVCGVKPREP